MTAVTPPVRLFVTTFRPSAFLSRPDCFLAFRFAALRIGADAAVTAPRSTFRCTRGPSARSSFASSRSPLMSISRATSLRLLRVLASFDQQFPTGTVNVDYRDEFQSAAAIEDAVFAGQVGAVAHADAVADRR